MTASGTRQVVVLEDGSVALEEHPLAPLGPGDALVRFVLSGVCGSDVHAAHGRLRQLQCRAREHRKTELQKLTEGDWLHVSLKVAAPPADGLGLYGTLKCMVTDDLARRRAARTRS